tara:strand:- start:127 stop:303 length:177 start_codon:yes stop_codon:yes gene_type:complete
VNAQVYDLQVSLSGVSAYAHEGYLNSKLVLYHQLGLIESLSSLNYSIPAYLKMSLKLS